ncbi:hypothetical protein [Pseudomonas parakoreensis]|uniref:hypothetical protein n=1 Tax=Pseudomonas parakoreensis TaxID=2892331 RepID=UPI003FD31FE1
MEHSKINPSKPTYEITALATGILGNLISEISEAQYEPLSGNLTIGWSTEDEFNASAYSSIQPSDGPEHKIVVNYELAIQLYRYAEGFYEFTQDAKFKKFLQQNPGYFPLQIIPSSTSKNSCINNMFFGSLTWILYHELGHAVQEHGIIRRKYGLNTGLDSHAVLTSELAVQGDPPLSRDQSIISHITELAADSEATSIAVFELLRHANVGTEKEPKFNWQIVLDNCYLLIASMACTFCRFNGGKMLPAEAIPSGSHPNAIFRLELVVRQTCKLLKFYAAATEHEITDRTLLILVKQAADLGTMFWYSKHSDRNVSFDNLAIKGLSERPEFKTYAKEIIPAWEKLLPDILPIRHFGSDFGILHFDKEYRQYVFEE